MELLSIVHAARARSRWAVLIVPDSLYRHTLQTISALSDVPASGRTILWPDLNRKLTVVSSKTKPFAGEFDLLAYGWGAANRVEETNALTEWRKAAKEFVSSSSVRLDSISAAA
jgi:hypothetical protein